MYRAVLGIDTSNYKTSVAIVSQEGGIICNLQRFLDVKKGERGLRQSVALFQHVNRLPEMIEEAFAALPPDVCLSGVTVSSRPRPVDGSYMPVFLAGVSIARSIAAAKGVPLFFFSHQEGHVAAVQYGSLVEASPRFLSFHLSGGTTECLLVEGNHIQIVGGSKDLAFGQVLDRVGVALGYAFPCGQELDRLAAEEGSNGPVKGNLLPKIKCSEGYINLSGIETKCQQMIGHIDDKQLSVMLMERVCQAMADLAQQLSKKYHTEDILFAGGVSASSYIRKYLPDRLSGLKCCFGDPALSCDNAVGVALLGGRKIWL